MRKNQLITTKSKDLILGRSKNLLKITQKILRSTTSNTLRDDSWIERLWEWADKYGIGRILPRNKEDLTTLAELHLNSSQLTELPKEIGNLKNLTTLTLWDNQLTELPKEIGNLKNLTMLALWNNQLTELPKEIGKLTNLTRLTVSRNQLTELPKEIGNLRNLTKLTVSRNQLTELPKEIGNLTNLTWITLHSNQLTELPREIGNLKNLMTLILAHNQLAELPKELGNLTNLEFFSLESNNLTELPEEIGNLTNLKAKESQESVSYKNITILDDLMWARESDEEMNWNDAMGYVKNLRLGGYDDWRLPTLEEIAMAVNLCGGLYINSYRGLEPLGSGTAEKMYENESNKIFRDKYKLRGFVYDRYWSSAGVGYSSFSWDIGWASSEDYYRLESNRYHVRCVRNRI